MKQPHRHRQGNLAALLHGRRESPGQFDALPQTWRHFLDWWETSRLDLPTRHHLNGTKAAAPSPCLPGLASNQWWTGAPGTMWTVWWHRFAVSTGYVVLYQDPKAGPAQAVNHKEPGEHFKIKQATDGSLAGHANPHVINVGGGGIQMAATPPTSASAPTLASLPVYDLHMRPVGTAGGSGLHALALRASIADRSSLFGGTCEWVGMADQQRARLAHEEGGRHGCSRCACMRSRNPTPNPKMCPTIHHDVI